MVGKYIFTSERLGFRNWIESDIPKMIDISADEKVMEFFTYVATPKQTKDFIKRMRVERLLNNNIRILGH